MDDQQLDPLLVEDPYPFQRHLGFRLTAWREGYARFDLPMEDFLLNRYGIPHGGVHAVMSDTVMGYAGCYTGDPDDRKLAMTLNLNVNYLGPLKGRTIIAEGTVTGGGARTYFAEARIRDELGNEAAQATGVFRRRGT
ncbi:thioesterase family protein [Pseudooceanicola batsensis HTCC2597]|uniref:Thioesterase family protein n=1 Tax=Pseudooceanicola batsensis (strain ATCC BAA-863 / DSM 15984 / KCTC 12145 / HTCC2597) TaxID=252305 RepID=A3TW00_PSEBH|nr:PaaI family thioesterase [Pseudooceanicola batsensis]EAQ03796.1 thioesterase family protein [Pseudooceanicola batsensis HTCC2597]